MRKMLHLDFTGNDEREWAESYGTLNATIEHVGYPHGPYLNVEIERDGSHGTITLSEAQSRDGTIDRVEACVRECEDDGYITPGWVWENVR